MSKNNYIYEEDILVGYYHNGIENLYEKLEYKLGVSYNKTGKNLILLCNAYQVNDGIYVCYEHCTNDFIGQTFIKRALLKLITEITDEESKNKVKSIYRKKA